VSMRRESLWDDTLFDLDVPSGGGTVNLLTLTPGDNSEGFTAVRTIISLSLFKNTVPAASAVHMVSLGVGLATKEAITLGATALPDPSDPVDQPIHDWVWRDRVVVPQDSTRVLAPVVVRVDIRAGRKLAGGALFLRMENDNLFGTAFVVQVAGVIRVLYLRP